MNQYIAALHTGIESLAGDEWRLAFHLNEPYGDYFQEALVVMAFVARRQIAAVIEERAIR